VKEEVKSERKEERIESGWRRCVFCFDFWSVVFACSFRSSSAHRNPDLASKRVIFSSSVSLVGVGKPRDRPGTPPPRKTREEHKKKDGIGSRTKEKASSFVRIQKDRLFRIKKIKGTPHLFFFLPQEYPIFGKTYEKQWKETKDLTTPPNKTNHDFPLVVLLPRS